MKRDGFALVLLLLGVMVIMVWAGGYFTLRHKSLSLLNRSGCETVALHEQFNTPYGDIPLPEKSFEGMLSVVVHPQGTVGFLPQADFVLDGKPLYIKNEDDQALLSASVGKRVRITGKDEVSELEGITTDQILPVSICR